MAVNMAQLTQRMYTWVAAVDVVYLLLTIVGYSTNAWSVSQDGCWTTTGIWETCIDRDGPNLNVSRIGCAWEEYSPQESQNCFETPSTTEVKAAKGLIVFAILLSFGAALLAIRERGGYDGKTSKWGGVAIRFSAIFVALTGGMMFAKETMEGWGNTDIVDGQAGHSFILFIIAQFLYALSVGIQFNYLLFLDDSRICGLHEYFNKDPEEKYYYDDKVAEPAPASVPAPAAPVISGNVGQALADI